LYRRVSARVGSIDAGTVTAPREHRERQAAERLKAGSLWTDSGLVFCAETGGPVDPGSVSALMGKLTRPA
jgi:integrase